MRFMCLFLGICLHKRLISAFVRTQTYEKLTDKRYEYANSSAPAHSAIACCRMCTRTEQCALVAYNTQTQECEMSEVLPGHERFIQSELGWDVYIDTENECTSNPCQNLGSCEDGIGHYTCWCTSGWSGQNCEIELCQEGWHQFEDSCYYIVTDMLSWEQAQKNCGFNGANLTNIKTKAENDFLINLFYSTQPTSGQHLWIGGNTYGTNTFYWRDNTTVESGYNYWCPGQPSGGDESCLEVLTDEDFRWNDVTCFDINWSVCQKLINLWK